MLLRKLFRTAWNYKSQFLSMILMVMIGVGVFVGFNMEWYSLERNVTGFFESTEYADYRIYSETGFSQEDIGAVRKVDGVEAASRILAVNVDVKGKGNTLSLFCAEDTNVSAALVTEGAAYDKTGEGVWLSDRFAAENGVVLGDMLTLTYRGVEISAEVVGLIKSSEYLVCVADETQLMPDFESFGFVYVSPEKMKQVLGTEFYPQINICSELSKGELEDALQGALGKTTLVVPKEEHMPYAGAHSEIEEGKTMAALLPVLFLAIGILTMVTTMHRIAANEKVQIGTLKALGFRDKRILWHYTSYGMGIGLLGSVLGIVLGLWVAGLVMSPTGMMGTYLDMPDWKLYVPWFCWLMVALTIALLTLISYLSVKKMLKGTAADALRPYKPKKGKEMKMERTRLFRSLGFSTRWNLRDVFRHKARSFMSLFGVIGCMLLLVGGLGMKDTMGAFFDLISDTVYHYTTKVNLTETVENEEALSFAEEYDGDWVAVSGIKLGDKTVTLEVYDVIHDGIRFLDERNETVTLGDEGAYICTRLAEDIKVGDTISFSPYGEEETYCVTVAGVLRSVMTENVVMTRACAEKRGIPYHISAIFTQQTAQELPDASFISGKQSKQAIMDSYDGFMEIMNLMVLIFVLAAVVLGVIVLYNLGVMSYVERSQELATLKVLGFRDKQIGSILIRQNVWLTVAGILIGLPAGVGVLWILIKTLASEYELKLTLGVLTYAVSLLTTFGVSVVVGAMVAGKNKKIDMVEALKGIE